MKRAELTLAVLIILCGTLRARAQEQTVFNSADAAVKNPVAIPADVLELLKNDPFASDAFTHDVPTACFSASSIRLGPRETDLIVEAEGCLRGENANMFWIFLATAHGHHLALGAPAHELAIEKHQSNGYHDLILTTATGNSVTTDSLKFNGKQYTLQRQKNEPVR